MKSSTSFAPLNEQERAERFWSRVEIDQNSGCWLWSGPINEYGYGVATAVSIEKVAHRASWVVHNGPIPKDRIVCHKCDVRVCLNPDHLYLGTSKSNYDDMVARNRLSDPERKFPKPKLTHEIVFKARNEKWSGTRLASEANVTRSVAMKALRGQTWRAVKENPHEVR